EHLIGDGHEVEVMVSNRAYDFLAKRFAGVHEIHGLHMIAEDNRMRPGKTVVSNIIEGAQGLPGNIEAYFELIERFEPEVVISDFESWTYLYGKNHRIPVISIDNMQVINRCTHPDEVLDGALGDFLLTKTFVKSKLPFCDHYLITTFFYPEIRKKRTSLHPPILRPEILAAKSSAGDHLLVYQTKEDNAPLVEALADTGLECRIYGMRRDLDAEHVEGNLRYRPFSEQGFIDDLASARAVVAGAGFTLMGEAVYLHKPMLALPMQGQFEQELNARYLQHVGYGAAASELTGESIQGFLAEVPRYQDNLAGYQQDGNRELLDALDHQLDKAAAGLF
ncbi:MAG: teichoic acid biosynthesis protein, partial [Deltaproteobacteria bacterium]|nr:teichoic acid biosynthesis protein [Deltaproteobacteria bacterium]